MRTAGIAMDNYKQKHFAKALTKAGFEFMVVGNREIDKTIVFKVKYEKADLSRLNKLIRNTNRRASRAS